MDHQEIPKPDVQEPSEGTPPLESSPPVHSETAEPATAQQLQQVEKEMSSFERSTLRWAKTAVIMSGIAAFFVCCQWYEMHIGGEDTHKLADAAIASNRPWVVLSGDIFVGTAPTYNYESGIKLLMANMPGFTYHIKNIGPSPAFNVSASIEPFFPPKLNTKSDYNEWFAAFNQTSDDACLVADEILETDSSKNLEIPSGYSLMPGTELPQQVLGGGKFSVSSLNERVTFKPYFLGCIRYTDEFDILHRTRFCLVGDDWKTPLSRCALGEKAD